jgi:CBS domain-containing protein
LIDVAALQCLSSYREFEPLALAEDVMRPPASVSPDSTLRAAARAILSNDLPEIPVKGPDGRLLGFLSETELFQAYLKDPIPLSTIDK